MPSSRVVLRCWRLGAELIEARREAQEMDALIRQQEMPQLGDGRLGDLDLTGI